MWEILCFEFTLDMVSIIAVKLYSNTGVEASFLATQLNECFKVTIPVFWSPTVPLTLLGISANTKPTV